MVAYTWACGAMSRTKSYYGGINMTGQDMVVCSSSPGYYVLNGFLRMPLGSTTSRVAIVYLIRKQYDPIVADTTLTAIDSLGIGYSGYPDSSTTTNAVLTHFYKMYSAIPSGTLLLKAVLLPADSEYTNFLPTYHDSAMQWSNAVPLTNGSFSSGTNITMKRGINPGGPGFIGGSVIAGANKSTAAGDPLAKRLLILTDAVTSKPVGYTYSDAAGKFSFSNLAIGTYKIFGDVMGKKNPALSITLTGTAGTVNNVLFKENRKDFTGQIGELSVAGTNPLLAGISAYPNPAASYVEVNGLTKISGSKTIILNALNGAVISRKEVAAGQTPRIATAALAPGIYLLQVQTAEGSVQIRLTK